MGNTNLFSSKVKKLSSWIMACKEVFVPIFGSKTIEFFVSGYCRDCETAFNLLIPRPIAETTMSFYDDTPCDVWDESINDRINKQHIKISDESVATCIRNKQAFANIYGSTQISKGRFNWNIKINNADINAIVIGIIGSKSHTIEYPDNALWKKAYGYSYGYSSGILFNDSKNLNKDAPFPKAEIGDVVTVKIDLDKYTLQFQVNGIETRDAIKIKKDKYKVAVGFLYK